MSPRRFPPQSPAHPGRKQDDSARQVSWLPGLSLRPPSQGSRLSGSWTTARRSQLRGQPRSRTAFPDPFREPRAYLNANSGARSGSMRDRRDLFGPAEILGRRVAGRAESRGLNSAAGEMHTAALWKSRVERFAAFCDVRMNGTAEMADLARGTVVMRARSARVFNDIGAASHDSCATQSCRALQGLRSSHNLRSRLPFTN
jgi:hypothetical protein